MPPRPPGPPDAGAASSICDGYAVPGRCHGNGTTMDDPGAGDGLAQSSRMNRPSSLSFGRSSVTSSVASLTRGRSHSCASIEASASSKNENHAFFERMHATSGYLGVVLPVSPSPSTRGGTMRRQNPVVLLPSPSVSENVYVCGSDVASSFTGAQRASEGYSGMAKFLARTVATSSRSSSVPSPPSAP